MTERGLINRLGLKYPIVQAPMAGGMTTPELVAAVSNAGGLGSFAAAQLSPQAIREGIDAIRALTNRSFNVNLFALIPPPIEAEAVARANAALAPLRARFGLPEPVLPERVMENYLEQAEAILTERVPVFSFTFGAPPAKLIGEFRKSGSFVIGTATTVAEARALEAAGVDAVCAQGFEAGGHRGTFLGRFEDSTVGTLALVPQVVDAVGVPVLAAGGIADGRGIAAALALGAEAAQIGTGFMRCPECGAAAFHKAAVARTGDDGTTITRAFSGRPARAIRNRFIEEMQPRLDDCAPYPVQLALTRGVTQAARAAGDGEHVAMLTGQAASLARQMPAAELIEWLGRDTEAAIARLASANF